jgi:G3E family GTPase
MKKRIPTNLITGFLGSGKTTTVLSILQQKPADEQWAVLVNEFGEVGIDGALLAGRGAEIRQIAGGCMCCVAELPMKVALNALINKTKPDRLLIETTGLGHPQALVDTLSDDSYAAVLDLRSIICLLDPRKLREQRYLEHPIFRDQLNIADVIVANKADLCDEADKAAFEQFLATLQPPKQAIGWVAGGQLQLEWLDLKHAGHRLTPRAEPAKASLVRMPQLIPLPVALQPGELFTRRENRGDGYFSCGWLFAESIRFDYQRLSSLLLTLKIARLKGLIRTNRGDYVLNNEDGTLHIDETNTASTSIIEMIHDQSMDWQLVEQQLLASQC